MEITTYIAKKICDSPKKAKENSPFFFCFPDKNYSSVWLSVGLLTNFFLEDYIQNDNDPGINPVPESNYEIYGNIAKYKRLDDTGRLVFMFAKKAQVPIHSKLRKFLKNTSRQRLSQLRDYYSNRQQIIENRSAISRILEPDEGILVNDQTLNSKVLLITGRNNTGKFREYIQNTIICGESLNQIFTRNGNLILKENLLAFIGTADDDYERKELEFIDLLKAFSDTVTDQDLCAELNDLFESLIENAITEDFDTQFCQIVNEYGGEIPDLGYLKDHLYPGFRPKLPENLKAVIINDIFQYELYSDSIKSFINNGIPVFIISDRLVDFHNNPSFYNNLFERHDACRINWNKGKIQELVQIEDHENNFVDAEFWTFCKRFALQKINIEIFDGCIIDHLMYDLRREIKIYPDYQRLREAYYNFLETAYCLVKNSDQRNEDLDYLTNCFRTVLNDVRNIINQELLTNLEEALQQIEAFESNTKEIVADKNNFSTSLNINGRSVTIPVFAENNNFPDYDMEQIVFTGFPYNESLRYFLHDAVCRYFIPDITVKTWPVESELTQRYITRRLRSGYYTDKICGESGFPANSLLLNNDVIQFEIDNSLNIIDRRNNNVMPNYPDQPPADDYDPEGDLVILAGARFNFQQYDANAPLVNPVRCHTVVFEDDSYLYMPIKGAEGVKAKVMIGRFDRFTNKFIVEKIDEGQLEAGQYLFDIDFYVDLPNVLRLSGFNQSEAESLTSRLYVWRQLLQNLFDQNGNSVEELTNFLISVKNDNPYTLEKSTPAIYNVRNWMHNEDILAPDLVNILLIFVAAGYHGPVTPSMIIEIRNKIVGSLIKLSHVVRNDIEKKFSGRLIIADSTFDYTKNNITISGDIKRIAAIVRNDLIVEYTRTRKVINL